jgi:hypothetical protein
VDLGDHVLHENATRSGFKKVGGAGVDNLNPENTCFPIPEMSEVSFSGGVRDELGAQNKALESAEKGDWGISLCSSQITQGEEREGSWLDTLSNGGSDQLELEEIDQGTGPRVRATKRNARRKLRW